MSETAQIILNQLKTMANEKAARIYQKMVVTETVLGVNKGPTRKLAQAYLPNHELGLELWGINFYETRVMAIMIMEPKKLSIQDLDDLVAQTQSVFVIDELTLEVFESFKFNEELFNQWRHHPDLMHQRCAWNSAIIDVHRKRLTLAEAEARLGDIETRLVDEPELVKYAMNRCMVEIALNYPTLTQRILSTSEKLGVYKEVMVAKGCTSPYAPDWIAAVQRRK